MKGTWIFVAGLAAGFLLPFFLESRFSPTRDLSVERHRPSDSSTTEKHKTLIPDGGRLFIGTAADRIVRLTRWASGALHADLLQHLETLSEEGLTELEWCIVLTRWAECDPIHFFEKASQWRQAKEAFSQESITRVLAETNLQLLLERDEGALATPRHARIDDPPRLLAWLIEHDHPSKDQLLPFIYRAWFRRDRAATLRSLEAMTDPDQQSFLMAMVAGAWGADDPRGALEWVMSFPDDDSSPPDRGRMFVEAMGAIKKSHPDLAWQLLTDEDTGLDLDAESVSMYREIIGRAAYQDPLAVLKWVATLEDQEAQRNVISMAPALSFDAEKLEEYLQYLPPGETKEWLALSVIGGHHSSIEERIARVAALDGVDQDRMLGRLLELSGAQFEEVAVHFDAWKHLQADARNAITESGLRYWTKQDPAAAAAWLGSLPPNDVAPDMVTKTWAKWTELQPSAASQALVELSPGPHRDAAIAGLIEEIALGPRSLVPDFEAAWQWAQTITANDQREIFTSRVASAWHTQSPEEAAKFIEP